MRTIHIVKHVYQYRELSAPAQARAREWWRASSASNDGEIFDNIIADAKDAGTVMGWTIGNVYWSGFGSQGDGACFTGAWHADDVQPVEKLEIQDPELIRIVTEMQSFKVAKKLGGACIDSVSATRQGIYYHDRSIEFGFNDDADTLPDEEFERFRELARDFMRWIYRAFELEYEWRNSDEYVIDAIEANEYEFTYEGEIA